MGERVQLQCRRSREDLSLCCRPFVNSKAQIFGDQRFYAIEEKIVQPRAGLAADFDGIFESDSCDQRSSGAFAF